MIFIVALPGATNSMGSRRKSIVQNTVQSAIINTKNKMEEENNKEIAGSPVGEKQDEKIRMEFCEALRYVITGNKITKLEWENEEYYGLMSNGQLTLHKPDGKLYQWIVSDGDIAGEDWVVLE